MSITLETLKSLDARIKDLNKQRSEFAQKYAEETCPYETGQRVPVKGYSYEGKEAVITQILPKKWGGHGWRVMGAVINSDGRPGKNIVSWSDNDL